MAPWYCEGFDIGAVAMWRAMSCVCACLRVCAGVGVLQLGGGEEPPHARLRVFSRGFCGSRWTYFLVNLHALVRRGRSQQRYKKVIIFTHFVNTSRLKSSLFLWTSVLIRKTRRKASKIIADGNVFNQFSMEATCVFICVLRH